MKINVPKEVQEIISVLQEHGHDAYAVGGCVRDSLLGRAPADWDITTSAKPMEVKRLFRRTVDTGIQHGTVTVMFGKEGFEVTTYRIDGEYEDGRHPKEVTFTGEVREDLRRRDFTINAMAYNDKEGLLDLFGGIDDLNKKVIRCVGNPEERFTEDALRIMRAVRFAGQLGFSIEEKQNRQHRNLQVILRKSAQNESRQKSENFCYQINPELLRAAYELGITEVVLPEFDAIMQTDKIHHIILPMWENTH